MWLGVFNTKTSHEGYSPPIPLVFSGIGFYPLPDSEDAGADFNVET